MKLVVAAFVTIGLAALAPDAAAQEAKGTIRLREIEIVGRVQKPVASVDVNRIQPKLTLAELRQPFLDRIEAAVSLEPF